MKKFIALLIFLLAVFLRMYNSNWDNNFHLHPDERFLTMVGNSIKLPSSLKEYFDPKISSLNPTNANYSFFVYGRFPLILNKYLAVLLNKDNYNDFTILGRQLSALFDILVIFFIFRTVALLEKDYRFSSSIKYWASFFYGISVLPIQLSHFFAVDTFLNFFMFGSFYFSLKFYYEKKIEYLCFSAIFFGLAMASKVTAVFILPLNLFLLLFTYLKRPSRIGKYLLFICIYFSIFYLTLRWADPYLFQNNSFFDLNLNKNFIESLKMQNSLSNVKAWVPPNVQWFNKPPIIFSLINLSIFGLGLPYFILVIIGILFIIWKFLRNLKFKSEKYEFIIIALWVISYFIYQSVQFGKTMRYFIFIYPFLAIFAGLSIDIICKKTKSILNRSIKISIISLVLFWPLLFFSIYLNNHTRVEASEWIYKNLPDRSIILNEHWDDSLPLPIENNLGKQFFIKELPVFDPDTPEKWRKINNFLKQADYYILSSNRGWGSITIAPEKYPLMSRFYQDLLSGKTPYKKIKEFTSYPSFKYLKISLEYNDQWSEEAFTVYDHPKVIILKKTN